MGRSIGWGFGLGCLAVGVGCSGSGRSVSKPEGPQFRGVKIVVAAVGGDAALPAAASQRGEWEASRGASAEVLGVPVDPASTGGAHVLVFRGDRLGDLVDAGALAVLPESVVRPPAAARPGSEDDDAPRSRATSADPSAADPLQFADVMPVFRDQVSKYGRDRLALPLGGSALVLVMNRSAFDGPANREAAGAAGLALEPPATWEALDALARFFGGRDWDGDGRPDSGIALALGADPEGLGDATLLARAASLGQHRDQFSLLFDADTMAPRVASPPFAEALGALVALRTSGPPGAEGFDAARAREAFRGGKVAMLIDRAERASGWGGGGVKEVGLAALPGSPRVFDPARRAWEDVAPANRPSYLPHGGGWLVGVAASARGREREAAVDFAAYLVGPDTSNRVRSDRESPMLPVRASQLGQGPPDPRSAPGVAPRAWSDAVSKTLLAARAVPGLRIPQAEGYLADLGKGRASAARGEPVAAALQGVAAAWEARTRSLGVARQLWHYRRSLNALATAPQPPPR